MLNIIQTNIETTAKIQAYDYPNTLGGSGATFDLSIVCAGDTFPALSSFLSAKSLLPRLAARRGFPSPERGDDSHSLELDEPEEERPLVYCFVGIGILLPLAAERCLVGEGDRDLEEVDQSLLVTIKVNDKFQNAHAKTASYYLFRAGDLSTDPRNFRGGGGDDGARALGLCFGTGACDVIL